MDTRRIREILERHYEGKFKSFRISNIERMAGGVSHYMYQFRLEYAEKTERHVNDLILRMTSETTWDKDGLPKEFRILKKLSSASIVTPKAYDLNEDASGSSFMIMEKMDGQSMWKFMMDMADGKHPELWKEVAGSLATIHNLEWKSMELGFLDAPDNEYGYINKLLLMLRKWPRNKNMEVYNFDPVIDWMQKHSPPSSHYTFLHGDYHPDNILVTEWRIAAIVDWEDAHIGDPAFDVCVIPLMLKIADPGNEWHSSLTDSFLEYYKAATRWELQNLDFYEIVHATIFLFFFLWSKIRADWVDIGLKTCAQVIKERTGIEMSI